MGLINVLQYPAMSWARTRVDVREKYQPSLPLCKDGDGMEVVLKDLLQPASVHTEVEQAVLTTT